MSKNSDKNTQVSTHSKDEVRSSEQDLEVVSETERTEPAAHLATLLKEAEDEAAQLKDAPASGNYGFGSTGESRPW